MYKGVKVRLKVLQAVSEGFLILYFWSCVERVWNFVVSKNATVVLLHRLNFRSFSIYRWFCLFPGRNVACSYFLLYASVPSIMKPLRDETDLVLSKPSVSGKDLEKISYFFNTCGGISFKQGFCFAVFFQMWLVVLLAPSEAGIFTL